MLPHALDFRFLIFIDHDHSWKEVKISIHFFSSRIVEETSKKFLERRNRSLPYRVIFAPASYWAKENHKIWLDKRANAVRPSKWKFLSTYTSNRTTQTAGSLFNFLEYLSCTEDSMAKLSCLLGIKLFHITMGKPLSWYTQSYQLSVSVL